MYEGDGVETIAYTGVYTIRLPFPRGPAAHRCLAGTDLSAGSAEASFGYVRQYADAPCSAEGLSGLFAHTPTLIFLTRERNIINYVPTIFGS